MSSPEIDHLHYLQLALNEARKSPPKPTNFCVGALVLSASSREILATGYTLECIGNTHAEQSCFIKLAQQHGCSEDELGFHLSQDELTLYTTMEPCSKRSVGNTPCAERVLALKRRDGSQAIRTVVVGVTEPQTFVGVNEGKKKLEDVGIKVMHVSGLEEEILSVATAGHVKDEVPRDNETFKV